MSLLIRTGGISVDISRDGITVAVMSLLIRTGVDISRDGITVAVMSLLIRTGGISVAQGMG